MRGMCRVFVMVDDILDHAIRDETEVTNALLVQLHKSLLLMALDGGSWDTA